MYNQIHALIISRTYDTIIRNRKQIYFIHQDINDQLDVIDKQKGMLDIIDK